MISKNIPVCAVAGLLIFAIGTPVTHAQVGSRIRTASSTPAFSCDSIDTMRAAVLEKMTQRANSLGIKQTGRGAEFEAAKTKRLTALETKREEYDAARNARYESMRTKATTEEQKAAVEAFIDTVEDLVTARKAAVDAAIEKFETDVAELKAEADDVMMGLRTDVEADINAVFDEAEDACGSESTAASIRAIITAGMQELRTSRQADRDEYTFRSEFTALREERLAAEKAAVAEFTAGIKSATETLKTAFGR